MIDVELASANDMTLGRKPSHIADSLPSHGYGLQEDAKEQQIMRPSPPLALLHLTASGDHSLLGRQRGAH